MSDYKNTPSGNSKIHINGRLWKDIETNDYGGKLFMVNSPYKGKGGPVSIFYDIQINEKQVEVMGKFEVGKGSNLQVIANVTGYIPNGEKYAKMGFRAIDIEVLWTKKDNKQATSPEVVDEVVEEDDDDGFPF